MADDVLNAERLDSLAGALAVWQMSAGNAATANSEGTVDLDQASLDRLYRTNTYAQIIVDAMPEDALRLGFGINYGEVEEEDAEDAAQDPIGDELWRLGLRQRLEQADKLARKDGRSAIYIGIDDGQDPSQPVNRDQIRRVTHLTVVEKDYCQPRAWQTDLTQPGFGEPLLYDVRPYSQGGGFSGQSVHRDRLLLIDGRWISTRMQAENGNACDSVLQRCWRLIQDFRRAESDMPKILRSFSQLILTMPGAFALLQGPNKDAALARILAFSTGMNLAGVGLLGEGEKAEYLTRTVAGVADLYDRLASGVAATAEMPLTRLFGHSPSGLSTDDAAGRTYWHARLQAHRQHVLQPMIEQLGHYVALAIDGPCEGVEPETWEVSWPALSEPTEAEAADIRSKQATTDRAYWDMGALSELEIRQSRFGAGAYSTATTLIEGEGPPPKPDPLLAPKPTAPTVEGEAPEAPGDVVADSADLDLTPPETVRAAARRGLQLCQVPGSAPPAGQKAPTLQLARGDSLDPQVALGEIAWWAGHADACDAPAGSPAATVALLHGGAAGREWFLSLARP